MRQGTEEIDSDPAEQLLAVSSIQLTSADANEGEPEDGFTIPELPSGRNLRLSLLSAWGDPLFVGLSAIEIFSAQGRRIEADDVERIESNVGECTGDLHALLTSRLYRACTDIEEMWSCPYRRLKDDPNSTPKIPVIDIQLKTVVTVAMIRVWNYCQSRIHALRGVRRMGIELDDLCIFHGEVSCAYDCSSGHPTGDIILFTTDEAILDAIANNDISLTAEHYEEESPFLGGSTEDRGAFENSLLAPSGRQGGGVQQSNTDSAMLDCSAAGSSNWATRPLTGGEELLPRSPVPSDGIFEVGGENLHKSASAAAVVGPVKTPSVEKTEDDSDSGGASGAISGKLIHMELLSSWGSVELIGLTGIRFIRAGGEPLEVIDCSATCSSRCNTRSGSLQKLLDGENLTTNPKHMWLADFDAGAPSMLSFKLAEESQLVGVSIWNYNASEELVCAGVKCAQFYINGRRAGGVVVLRKAPGFVYFDFVQDIDLRRCHLFRPLSSRPDTKSICAFIYQLKLLASWGDEFYIGLNGIELYGRRNERILLGAQNLAAFPESINILPFVKNDPRSSDKLIDGVNDTNRPSHMWLTALLPNQIARVFVIFDYPTYVSRIRIFNYRRNAERGVQHVSISADDLIAYSGEIPQSSAAETGILDVVLRELDK